MIKPHSHFIKAKEVDASKFRAQSTIKRNELVRLIAQRIKDNLDLNDVKSRVSKKLTDHINKNKLTKPIDGKFVFGEAIHWARVQWPKFFNDLPSILPITTASINSTLPAMTAKAVGYSFPVDVSTCHDEIVRLFNLCLSKDDLVKNMQATVNDLLPDALRYREIQRINGVNGSKGGRGNAM